MIPWLLNLPTKQVVLMNPACLQRNGTVRCIFTGQIPTLNQPDRAVFKMKGYKMAPLAPDISGEGIYWETNMDEVLRRARAENKLVLLDFFNPN